MLRNLFIHIYLTCRLYTALFTVIFCRRSPQDWRFALSARCELRKHKMHACPRVTQSFARYRCRYHTFNCTRSSDVCIMHMCVLVRAQIDALRSSAYYRVLRFVREIGGRERIESFAHVHLLCISIINLSSV